MANNCRKFLMELFLKRLAWRINLCVTRNAHNLRGGMVRFMRGHLNNSVTATCFRNFVRSCRTAMWKMQDMKSNAVCMAASLINGMQNKFPAKILFIAFRYHSNSVTRKYHAERSNTPLRHKQNITKESVPWENCKKRFMMLNSRETC